MRRKAAREAGLGPALENIEVSMSRETALSSLVPLQVLSKWSVPGPALVQITSEPVEADAENRLKVSR